MKYFDEEDLELDKYYQKRKERQQEDGMEPIVVSGIDEKKRVEVIVRASALINACNNVFSLFSDAQKPVEQLVELAKGLQESISTATADATYSIESLDKRNIDVVHALRGLAKTFYTSSLIEDYLSGLGKDDHKKWRLTQAEQQQLENLQDFLEELQPKAEKIFAQVAEKSARQVAWFPWPFILITLLTVFGCSVAAFFAGLHWEEERRWWPYVMASTPWAVIVFSMWWWRKWIK